MTTDRDRNHNDGTLIGIFKPLAYIALLSVAFAISCGSGDGNGASVSDVSGDEAETRTFDRDVVISGDDLISLGLKSGKNYDVATLPGGVEARLFFWRVNSVAVEYEARFYESHADAVELGIAPAAEGSGEDAILDSDDAVYKEGIRDRRTIFDFRAAPKPKYGTYAIYANMVVLCEGRDDDEAWDRCTALVDALESR